MTSTIGLPWHFNAVFIYFPWLQSIVCKRWEFSWSSVASLLGSQRWPSSLCFHSCFSLALFWGGGGRVFLTLKSLPVVGDHGLSIPPISVGSAYKSHTSNSVVLQSPSLGSFLSRQPSVCGRQVSNIFFKAGHRTQNDNTGTTGWNIRTCLNKKLRGHLIHLPPAPQRLQNRHALLKHYN